MRCLAEAVSFLLLNRLGPWGLELDPNWGGPDAAAQQLGRTGSSSAPALMGRPGDANGWPGPPAGLGAAVPAAGGPSRLAGPPAFMGRAANLGGPGPTGATASYPGPQPQQQLHPRPGAAPSTSLLLESCMLLLFIHTCNVAIQSASQQGFFSRPLLTYTQYRSAVCVRVWCMADRDTSS